LNLPVESCTAQCSNASTFSFDTSTFAHIFSQLLKSSNINSLNLLGSLTNSQEPVVLLQLHIAGFLLVQGFCGPGGVGLGLPPGGVGLGLGGVGLGLPPGGVGLGVGGVGLGVGGVGLGVGGVGLGGVGLGLPPGGVGLGGVGLGGVGLGGVGLGGVGLGLPPGGGHPSGNHCAPCPHLFTQVSLS
jgi:hypothetical protein